MLYTLMTLALMAGPTDTVVKIEGMHLKKAVCEQRAKELAGSKCRLEIELDGDSPHKNSVTKIQLPSGRVVDVAYSRGSWFYPIDLQGADRQLIEGWTKTK